jgi:DNA-binding MarR family transcriptional regulator
MKPTQAASATTGDRNLLLELEKFLPYRLVVLSNTVSVKLAAVYAKQFNLTVAEWRVIAIIGRFPEITARDIAERGAMDKVTVSRAVAGLVSAGRLERVGDPADRRRVRLAMTATGREIYRRIVPLARACEQQLLAGLNTADQAALDRLLTTLLDQARGLPG